MGQSNARLGGSGSTVVLFQGVRMAYLQVMQDTPPTPVATAQAVQPIDEPVPLEIVTAQAVGVGTMRTTFYELWNLPVWAMLPGFQGTMALVDVLQRQISLGAITIQKIIKSPLAVMRSRIYHGVTITDVDQGENITIASMTLPKSVTFQYAYSTLI